ncbi:MAG: hypothetical protein FD174_3522 [Geobacteraceae bacterium]|nr:MAG: hypothetical protein FD174_3522 [Geobacteraceae bacterium]
MKGNGLIGLLTVLLLLHAGIVMGAPQKTGETDDTVKQGEFAAKLVSAFRWEKGLPKEPAEKDYLAILGGKRTFKFEAEDYYSVKTDDATVLKYPLYGPFSGRGWVSGVAVPTTVHLKVFLPLEGEYTLSVAAKGDGQSWSVGDKAFKVSTGKSLREVVAGSVYLPAGPQEITIGLPPEGGIDYMILAAPSLTPIEPLGGWRSTSPLRLGELAEVAAVLLGWEKELAPDKTYGPKIIAVSEAAELPPTVAATDVKLYGQFSADKWIRAGYGGATVEVPLTLDKDGVYDLKIRFMGDKLAARLDGEKIIKAGKPSLDWVELGLYRLEQGSHKLQLDIPPDGGVDVVVVEKRKSSPADYMELVGLHGDPAAVVSRAEAEKVLTSLVERFKGRK